MTDAQQKARFTVQADAIISAPPEKIWQILLDFSAYPEWNPFVTTLTLVDASRKAVTSHTVMEGDYVLVGGVHATLEKVRRLDHNAYCFVWGNDNPSSRMFTAERLFSLTDIGEGQTRFEIIDAFGGVLSYAVQLLLKRSLEKGQLAMAEALKRRAEKL